MIIESHTHLGIAIGQEPELTITETKLMSILDENQVDKAIVLPFPGTIDEAAAHDDIAALAKKYPKRIFGCVTLHPHKGHSLTKVPGQPELFKEIDFSQEVERCVKQLKFVAIKLHPGIHWCTPGHKDALKIFQAAQDYDIPLIIHTGRGIPHSLPSLVAPRAKQFPKVKIVMAHSGATFYTEEAMQVAAEYPNVYLETSLCMGGQIRGMVNRLGAERVMFGADVPYIIPTALADYRASGLSLSQLEQCLSGTAREVFKLP